MCRRELFRMRWGVAGTTVAHGVVLPHIRRLLRERFAPIKILSEGDEWRSYTDGWRSGLTNISGVRGVKEEMGSSARLGRASFT